MTLSYLRMFSAIEGLIKVFGGAANIAPTQTSQTLQGSLHVELAQLRADLIDSGTEPKLLSSLDKAILKFGQPTFRGKFESFCESWQVPTDDLWPMFAAGSRNGLTEIRNRLVHGGELSEEREKAVSIAHEHLMFVLLRILLRVLGLKISDARVNYPQGGQGLIMFTELLAARATIKSTA